MRFDDTGTPTMETNARCPKCRSEDVVFSKKRGVNGKVSKP